MDNLEREQEIAVIVNINTCGGERGTAESAW